MPSLYSLSSRDNIQHSPKASPIGEASSPRSQYQGSFGWKCFYPPAEVPGSPFPYTQPLTILTQLICKVCMNLPSTDRRVNWVGAQALKPDSLFSPINNAAWPWASLGRLLKLSVIWSPPLQNMDTNHINFTVLFIRCECMQRNSRVLGAK